MFTQAEVDFLFKGHGNVEARGGRVERAAGLRSLEDVDFRGCPPHVMESILQRRAKMLGPIFEKFRAEHQSTDDLALRIAGSQLF